MDLAGEAGSAQSAHIPLDRKRIVQKALDMLNEVGLKELSMRKIGDALGVKAASLYYHVKDKDELLQLIADQISLEMGMNWADASLPWKDQMVRWAEHFRAVLHKHRDAADIFGSTIALGPYRLQQIEALYKVFDAAGFRDEQIPWLSGMLKNYVLGFVSEEVRLTGMAQRKEVDVKSLGEQYLETYGRLPRDKFPHLIRLAPYSTGAHWEDEFHFGLKVLLDGFNAQLR
nr:TetR/AcrR family transcriptional regulator C-terminal domain-containing protein [Paenibacillus hamazuiensis]